MFKPNEEVNYTFNLHTIKFDNKLKKRISLKNPRTRPAVYLGKGSPGRAFIQVQDPCGFRKLSVALNQLAKMEEACSSQGIK